MIGMDSTSRGCALCVDVYQMMDSGHNVPQSIVLCSYWLLSCVLVYLLLAVSTNTSETNGGGFKLPVSHMLPLFTVIEFPYNQSMLVFRCSGGHLLSTNNIKMSSELHSSSLRESHYMASITSAPSPHNHYWYSSSQRVNYVCLWTSTSLHAVSMFQWLLRSSLLFHTNQINGIPAEGLVLFQGRNIDNWSFV